MVLYGMFRVYEYFYNLIISRVIINTLLCKPYFKYSEILSHRSRGCRHTDEPFKICVLCSCFSSPILITIVA